MMAERDKAITVPPCRRRKVLGFRGPTVPLHQISERRWQTTAEY